MRTGRPPLQHGPRPSVAARRGRDFQLRARFNRALVLAQQQASRTSRSDGSQNQQAVRGRARAPGQCRQHRAAAKREGAAQRFSMELQGRSVCPGLGDEEDHSIQARVALLEKRFAFDGLDVAKTRLCLDADPCTIKAGPAVERAKVARDWQWNLSCPRRPRREAGTKAREQLHVAGVANGIPGEIGPKGDVETHSGSSECKLAERYVLELVPLESSERRVVHSDSRRRGSQAESRSSTRDPDLCTDLSCGAIDGLERTIPSTFAARHG